MGPFKERIINLVNRYKLTAHPEGGYYRETYRSTETIEMADGRVRSASTAILFMLTSNNFSAFHRIKSDEIWHYYEGCKMVIHMLSETQGYKRIVLSHKFDEGASYQAVVPAGTWFATELMLGGHYALSGCTVSPGFDFADFELANTDSLALQFPDYAELIGRLTRQHQTALAQ